MTLRQLIGDCRVTLATLPERSVQSAITSPPYYGLRDYGTPPLVWGGDASHSHEWGAPVVREFGRPQGQTGDRASRTYTCHGVATEQFCPCGAWLGSLGLEPTPELFIEHLVDVFRQVRRVLRDDGCLLINLGDSYAGSGNGAHDYRERATSASFSLNPEKYKGQKPLQRVGPQEHTEGHGRVQGYKPKDLMMMPARVALALQQDGWILRSMMPWLKRSAMPESVTDRPASSVEYWFLLTKQARYFWDADAVRVRTGNEASAEEYAANRRAFHNHGADGVQGMMQAKPEGFKAMTNPAGRNMRNGDLFFASWQGLLLDEDDAPMAMVVNPAGFNGAHFATFPPKLVEPLIKATSRAGDTVLDPFAGAGTVLLVADRLGRNAIGCELSDSYASLATDRLTGDAPMFVELSA